METNTIIERIALDELKSEFIRDFALSIDNDKFSFDKFVQDLPITNDLGERWLQMINYIRQKARFVTIADENLEKVMTKSYIAGQTLGPLFVTTLQRKNIRLYGKIAKQII